MTREQAAQNIIENAGAFCVCEGCGSILKHPLRRDCPSCSGYRFDASRERVIAQATLLATKPQESVIDGDLQ